MTGFDEVMFRNLYEAEGGLYLDEVLEGQVDTIAVLDVLVHLRRVHDEAMALRQSGTGYWLVGQHIERLVSDAIESLQFLLDGLPMTLSEFYGESDPADGVPF